MPCRKGFLTSFCAFAPITAAAGIAPSLPTFPALAAISPAGGAPIPPPATTPPPIPLNYDDLRKRVSTNAGSGANGVSSSSSGVGYYNYACGTADGQFWACNDHNLYCMATILDSGKAYQYCSTTEVEQQVVFTTFVGFAGSSSEPCRTLEGTGCCYNSDRFIQTNYFVASGYTVTAFNCQTEESTATWNPYTDILNPASFSASLARATTASSTGTPTSTTSSSAASNPTDQSSNSSGLSSGAKIGIGVGVGVGVGIVLLGALAFFYLRRREKKKEGVPEVTTSQQPYDPHMSYNQSQYYQQGTTSPPQWSSQQQWSPQMSAEPKYSTVPVQEPVELGSGTQAAHEMPGNEATTNVE